MGVKEKMQLDRAKEKNLKQLIASLYTDWPPKGETMRNSLVLIYKLINL